jgi:hypothetical protein
MPARFPQTPPHKVQNHRLEVLKTHGQALGLSARYQLFSLVLRQMNWNYRFGKALYSSGAVSLSKISFVVRVL